MSANLGAQAKVDNLQRVGLGIQQDVFSDVIQVCACARVCVYSCAWCTSHLRFQVSVTEPVQMAMRHSRHNFHKYLLCFLLGKPTW